MPSQSTQHGTSPPETSESVRPEQSKIPVEFTISEASRRPEQVVVVRLALRNTSQDLSLWVNYRLGISNFLSPFAEVAIDVSDEVGHPVRYSCMDKRSLPDEHDYIVLKPGSEISVVKELRCFAFAGPGTYSIQARYKDSNPQPPPRPPGVGRHFYQELSSNRLIVSVPEKS